MKKALLLGMLCTAITAQAVPLHKPKSITSATHYAVPFSVMQQQLSRAVHKPTATMYRLKATAYTANSAAVDSHRYSYSGGRGSANALPNSYFNTYSLTGNNQTQDIMFDTCFDWYDYGSGLEEGMTTTHSYNAQNKVTQTNYISTYGSSRYNGIYNTAGQLIRTEQLDTFGGTQLIVKRSIYMTYGTSGNRESDSAFSNSTNMPGYKRTYTYDSNNNLLVFTAYQYSNNQWRMSLRQTSTYDNNNRQLTQYTEGDYGSGFMMQSRDSFAYTGTAVHPIYHSTDEWDDNNSVWNPTEILSYTLNSNQLPDTYIIYRYDNNQWDTVERDVYTYDGNNLMVRSNGYLYTGNGQFNTTPYDVTNLYYEEYYPASVLTTQEGKPQVMVYPNPANNKIQVNVKDGISKVAVVGIDGRVLHTHAVKQAGVQTVDISTLPAGNYAVVLSGSDGITSSAMFTKQ